MYYINSGDRYLRIGGTYWLADIKEGPAIVIAGGSNRDFVSIDPVYDPTNETAIATTTFRHSGLTLVLADDDVTMEWVPTTQEATLDTYRYVHKFVTHIAPASFGSYQQAVVWTETPTRRKSWRREGSGLVADEKLPPAKFMRDVFDVNPTSNNNLITSLFTSAGVAAYTRSLPSFTGTDDLLDGAWFKLTRPEYPNNGLLIFRDEPTGSGEQAYCLIDANDVTLNYPTDYETVYGFDAIQFERVFDTEGAPTGEWKLFVNQFHGYIGTSEFTRLGSRYIMTQASDNITVLGPWNVTYFNWELNIDQVNGTIQFENVGLRDIGEPNRFWGADQNTLKPFTEMRAAADVATFDLDMLFVPNQYAFERYDSSTPLTIECCRRNVTETGIPPSGFGAEINYDIYCPADYSPPTSTAPCESFMSAYCTAPETKDDIACSCFDPTDLPLLPDNATITTYRPCFSVNCRTAGYVPLDQQDDLGNLSCPLTTLCTELAAEEVKDGDIYGDAKMIVGCSSGPPEPEPEDSFPLVWIIVIAVGGVALLALIIGLAVGLPAAARKEKEKKEEEELKKDLELQQELFALQALQRRIQ